MSAASWINRNIFGGQVNGPPGPMQGAPQAQAVLIPGANGTMIDQRTGQVYVNGPNGLTAQQTPNVAQQIPGVLNRANGFYSNVPGYDTREAQAYGGENQLAGTLNRMAMGTGPSVAGAQLATGLDQGDKQILSQAAGASGNNAALARMAAMGTTGNMVANTNQQQAVARTGEQMGAINALGGLYGNMAQQSQGMAGQNINAGNYLTNMGMQGEEAREGLTEKANEAEAQNNTSAMGKVLNFGSAIASSL